MRVTMIGLRPCAAATSRSERALHIATNPAMNMRPTSRRHVLRESGSKGGEALMTFSYRIDAAQGVVRALFCRYLGKTHVQFFLVGNRPRPARYPSGNVAHLRRRCRSVLNRSRHAVAATPPNCSIPDG